MTTPTLSIVIPVYNEEAGLATLFARLYPALDALGEAYEILFVNDGSRDRSAAILRQQFEARPDVTRVILLGANAGQHMAIMAGFEHCHGDIVVTLDADLQNPPEEIGKLVAKMRDGHDYVGSIRRERQDSLFRTWASKAMNLLRERITRIKITDQGNMLRAYSRSVVNAINSCKEVATFIPALAYSFARNPAEVVVEHEERAAGESKYSVYSLIRLNFDLVTGFSLVPLQWFSMLGILVSLGSAALFVLLIIRRLIVGPEAEGLFTLFALMFFLIGLALFGIGLLGEYIGRIYQQVRHRPRYLVEAVLERKEMSRAVVFAYHNVGVRCLSVLLAHGIDVARVVTHKDSPGETIWFDSVAELAARNDIPVITPEDPNDPAVVAELTAFAPDFLFSFYYRLMLKAPLLAMPRLGAWNMHGSLLPRYRGRVPVNWAIIHGERETGATLHRMLEKPDAGGILARQAVPILPDDTAFDVFNKVTLAAEMALDRVLPELLAGRAQEKPQDLASGSYFGGRKAEDGRIDWTRPAADVHNLIRAVAPPYPGAFSDTARGRLRVLRSLHPTGESGPHGGRPTLFVRNGHLYAECGDGRVLRLLAVELQGSALAPSPSGDQINEIIGNALPLS